MHFWLDTDFDDNSSPAFFAAAKNYWCKSKIIQLTSAIIWNMSAIKIPNVNLRYNSKMGGNSTFILKLVSRSFRIQKCNLSTLFQVAYFELWEK